MSVLSGFVEVGLPVAHPVSGHPHVQVPILAVSVGVALLVTLALLALPRAPSTQDADPAATASWSGSLTRAQVAVRIISVLVLVLAVAAARFGSPTELENLTPALMLGVAWPLLTVVSLVLPVWRWVDPWDGLARALAPKDDSEPAGQVWPAVVLAFASTWYVAVYARPFDPRALGLVLLGYTTFTVAACLVVGRRRWLSSGEPLGIALSWITAAARGRLGSPALPRGAAALVGVATGGLLFAILRRTGLWSDTLPARGATLYDTAGLVACSVLGAGLVAGGVWLGKRLRDRGAVLQAAPLALVGVVAALALERNRFFTSAQLLPGLVGDPFGAGWDLLGPAGQGLNADPLGAAGLIAAQVVVLTVGLVWGAVVAARRSPRAARVGAVLVLGYLALLSTAAVSLH